MTSPRARPKADFWRDKKVLVTGHSGFKGGWLSIWLARMGANITGVSLPPITQPNLFSLANIKNLVDSRYCDLREADKVLELVQDTSPDIVMHLAAQSLVRPGYKDPLGTYQTNIMGTANLLDALRLTGNTRVVVAATTDKVYRDVETPHSFIESDALGGHDPYSTSKCGTEFVIAGYRDAYFQEAGTRIAAARAGNVIGGGDWSEDRLIPDAVRAWSADRSLEIRNPDAVRPWQHVLEPLSGYLVLAERLWDNPNLDPAYNFGPKPDSVATVRQVVQLAVGACSRWRRKAEIIWGTAADQPRETSSLILNADKVEREFGISPIWSLQQAVGRTMGWYLNQLDGANAQELCEIEIRDYEGVH